MGGGWLPYATRRVPRAANAPPPSARTPQTCRRLRPPIGSPAAPLHAGFSRRTIGPFEFKLGFPKAYQQGPWVSKAHLRSLQRRLGGLQPLDVRVPHAHLRWGKKPGERAKRPELKPKSALSLLDRRLKLTKAAVDCSSRAARSLSQQLCSSPPSPAVPTWVRTSACSSSRPASSSCAMGLLESLRAHARRWREPIPGEPAEELGSGLGSWRRIDDP